MSEIFLEILNRSIASSWIILAVLVLRLLLKKAPKWIAVLLWAVVAVRLICPFSIESVLSLIPSAETVSPDIMYQDTPHITSGIPVINATVNPYIGEHFGSTPYYSANPLQILIPSVAWGWLLGVIGMLGYALVSWWLLKRKLKTAVLLRDNIYQSENVPSPFVLGVIRPKIYLPFGMGEQETHHVIAHEKAHIRRKDHLWKPLGFFLLSACWFNPLFWVAYILLCRDIELACDEKVIRELDTEQKADYSQALLTCSVKRPLISACPLAFGEVGVKERVKKVLNYKKPAFWIITAAVILGIVFTCCFLTDPMSDKYGITDPEQMTGQQRGLMQLCPKYFGLDASKGLDIYVWQVPGGDYRFGVLPHTRKLRDDQHEDLQSMPGVNLEGVQQILMTYPVELEDMHIILWQHPRYGDSVQWQTGVINGHLIMEKEDNANMIRGLISSGWVSYRQRAQMNDRQRIIAMDNAALCRLDSSNGLDVYLIEMQEGVWEGYLIPHKILPSFSSNPDISVDMLDDFVSVGLLQRILYTYNLAEEDVYIKILDWKNPETGFLGSYSAVLPGETEEDAEARRAECVKNLRDELLEDPFKDANEIHLSNICDQMTADIDGDGKAEECMIVMMGTGTNFPWYQFLAKEQGEENWEYDSVIVEANGNDGDYSGVNFDRDAQGTIYITAIWQAHMQEHLEIHRFDLKIEQKTVKFLLSSKTGVGDLDPTLTDLMRSRPEYFGLDDSNGLDVYVWQMAKNQYSFGLLPHTETPREWICDETMTLMNSGVNAEGMRAILSTYSVGEVDIYIIPWQNPLSSYLGDWQIVEEGKNLEEVRKAYVENVRQMLFGAQSNSATLLYAAPALSWVINEVPRVIVKDGQLFSVVEDNLLGMTGLIGRVSEITLTEADFYNLISESGGQYAGVAEDILENNLKAYEVNPIPRAAVDLYYVLMQKDGTTILVYGHYANGEKSDFIRWIFQIEE